MISFHILNEATKKRLLNSVLSIQNCLLRHYDHVKSSDFVVYQVFQTTWNNKNAKPTASCFHLFVSDRRKKKSFSVAWQPQVLKHEGTSSQCFNTAFNWLNFIFYNMFMPMNSKKNWANGGTTEQTRNANERTNGSLSERTSERANE